MVEPNKRVGVRRVVRRCVVLLGFGGAALCVGAPPAAAVRLLAQASPDVAVDSKPADALGTPAVVIDGKAAESLLGKKVQNQKGDDLGRIIDVIVDKAGQIRAAIVDFGGFLGVGSRKIAVDWHAVHMSQDGKLDHLMLDMPADQLRSAPAYKEGEPVVVVGMTPEPAKPPGPTPAATPAVPPPAPPSQN